MNLAILDQAAYAIAQEPAYTWAAWIDYIVEAIQAPDAEHSEQPALVAAWRTRYIAMLAELQHYSQQRQIDQQRQRAIERSQC
jgi:hypothetical protein